MRSPGHLGTGLEQNVLSSVRKLGLSYRSGILQRDNGPKHTENDTQEWLRAEPFTTSLGTDLNPFQHTWKKPKPAAWRNSLQTRVGCMVWAKTPQQVQKSRWEWQKQLLSVLNYFTHYYGFFNAKGFVHVCMCGELEKLPGTTDRLLNKEFPSTGRPFRQMKCEKRKQKNL